LIVLSVFPVRIVSVNLSRGSYRCFIIDIILKSQSVNYPCIKSGSEALRHHSSDSYRLNNQPYAFVCLSSNEIHHQNLYLRRPDQSYAYNIILLIFDCSFLNEFPVDWSVLKFGKDKFNAPELMLLSLSNLNSLCSFQI
jgi:hypothetical protein